MLNAVTANFLGDNLQCWMQIQSGKGPWSSEVSGIVKIGQTMTMVLGIKDEENKFDMVVSSKSWEIFRNVTLQFSRYYVLISPNITHENQARGNRKTLK